MLYKAQSLVFIETHIKSSQKASVNLQYRH